PYRLSILPQKGIEISDKSVAHTKAIQVGIEAAYAINETLEAGTYHLALPIPVESSNSGELLGTGMSIIGINHRVYLDHSLTRQRYGHCGNVSELSNMDIIKDLVDDIELLLDYVEKESAKIHYALAEEDQ